MAAGCGGRGSRNDRGSRHDCRRSPSHSGIRNHHPSLIRRIPHAYPPCILLARMPAPLLQSKQPISATLSGNGRRTRGAEALETGQWRGRRRGFICSGANNLGRERDVQTVDGAGHGIPGNTHCRIYCVAICAEVNRPRMNMPKDGSPFLPLLSFVQTEPQMLSQNMKSFPYFFPFPGSIFMLREP